ncbi:lysostaphin resistance A-like protein [Glutamicibacter endophyticus]|uniref:CPBP family intramembrane glutamic endopeptidase n=1 Tax=Glutamicibacter endophyticus TaxID=1522174 RepID=UPI003AEF6A63
MQQSQFGPPAYFPPRRRQRVFDAGRFHRGDFFTVLAYLLLFVGGGAALLTLVPGYMEAFPSDQAALFGVNLILYSGFFILAMIQCGQQFFESFATMRYLPWVKWLMLPAGWFATIIVSAAVAMLAGGPEISENQQALQSMTSVVPFPVMFAVTALFGPFVEEYLFRHLLIGKLSRRVNVWICAVISTVLFASIHFVGSGQLTNIVQVLPYLFLGVLMSLAYILSGKSLAYAYMMHVVNNGIALTVSYTLAPMLPGLGV